MKRYLPSFATLLLCLICAALQLYWGGQDKQGQFHADKVWTGDNFGVSIFVIGPYTLLALSALIARGHRASRIGLALALVLCAITVSAGWMDHVQYLRTPAGRENTSMLSFLANIVAWIGSFVGLLIMAVMSLAYDDRKVSKKTTDS